ncbi:periplasmic binding protein-like II [Periconia macrospinosa]|uniref:Periplasmic binding protein-like II n=1 Tax=Periconia macrospinosa TaxID=97972 RepID=A0A2V1DU96_9PLEO|nr:periplasmic binding protein-like II [Periconia macrospinosa]
MFTSKALHITLPKVDFPAPNQVTDSTSVLTLKNLVHEPLIRWNPHGVLTPGLFAHWTSSDDRRTWRFTIRPNANFHDGKKCTASDVTSFITAILDSRDTFGMRWSYHRYLSRATITAENDATVVVTNPSPCEWVKDVFTDFYLSRVDERGFGVLGTGRYKVLSYLPGKKVELLSLNPSARYIHITFTAEPNPETRLEFLQTAQTDAALGLEDLPTHDLQTLKTLPSITLITKTSTLSVIFYLNCTSSSIFSSPNARRAINHALDTSRLIRDVYADYADPASTIVSPFHLGAAQSTLTLPIRYDPVEARRLFEESGIDFSNPPTITLRTPTFMPTHAEAISNFVAEALRAIGFNVTVEVETNRPAYAKQIGFEKNVGDLALFDSSPNSTFRVLDDKISSGTKGIWWQGYVSEGVEGLIGRANDAVGEDERVARYGEVLKRLGEDPPWLFVVHPVAVLGVKKGDSEGEVQGVFIDQRGALVID